MTSVLMAERDNKREKIMRSYDAALLAVSTFILMARDGPIAQPCISKKRVGRNEACPCGKQKEDKRIKFKNCCIK